MPLQKCFWSPTSAVEVKENCHLMRHLEWNFFLSCFPEKYTENDAMTAIANTLKGTSDKTGEVVKRRDWRWLLQTSLQTSFKMTSVRKRKKIPVVTVLIRCQCDYANDNLINDLLHLKKLYPEKFLFQMYLTFWLISPQSFKGS